MVAELSQQQASAAQQQQGQQKQGEINQSQQQSQADMANGGMQTNMISELICWNFIFKPNFIRKLIRFIKIFKTLLFSNVLFHQPAREFIGRHFSYIKYDIKNIEIQPLQLIIRSLWDIFRTFLLLFLQNEWKGLRIIFFIVKNLRYSDAEDQGMRVLRMAQANTPPVSNKPQRVNSVLFVVENFKVANFSGDDSCVVGRVAARSYADDSGIRGTVFFPICSW